MHTNRAAVMWTASTICLRLAGTAHSESSASPNVTGAVQRPAAPKARNVCDLISQVADMGWARGGEVDEALDMRLTAPLDGTLSADCAAWMTLATTSTRLPSAG
ncbi:hypothetical protein ONZ51_g2684 [Trametes cubensis]|uniref:Secreted protein n=1 Tax=Trametes cubensis TaxID=1111947 RepID=A0AAD7XEA2_9APHY|nr:hypothetical protein ONZ51_g2684 [Trametes cubensis]